MTKRPSIVNRNKSLYSAERVLKYTVEIAGYTAVDLAGTYVVEYGPSIDDFKNDLRQTVTTDLFKSVLEESLSKMQVVGAYAAFPGIRWKSSDNK